MMNNSVNVNSDIQEDDVELHTMDNISKFDDNGFVCAEVPNLLDSYGSDLCLDNLFQSNGDKEGEAQSQQILHVITTVSAPNNQSSGISVDINRSIDSNPNQHQECATGNPTCQVPAAQGCPTLQLQLSWESLKDFWADANTRTLLTTGLNSFLLESGKYDTDPESAKALLSACKIVDIRLLIPSILPTQMEPPTIRVVLERETLEESMLIDKTTAASTIDGPAYTPARNATFEEKMAYLQKNLSDNTIRAARIDMDRCCESATIAKLHAGGNVIFPVLFSQQEIEGGNMSGKKSQKNPGGKKYNEFKVDVFSELMAWLLARPKESRLEQFEKYLKDTECTGLVGTEFEELKKHFLVDYANRIRPKRNRQSEKTNVSKKRKKNI